MLTLSDLRCEYAVNPLGLDAARPRFSWILNAGAGERGQRQAACQVVVASAPELLDTAPDVWDSGKLESAANLVEYDGDPLSSGQRCWWQARAWDASGQPGPYSAPAWFEMGLLAPADWRAEWIGFPGAWPGQALFFRHDFQLERPVRRARVYWVGLGWAELHVNGQRIGDRVLDPPQTDYSKRVLYSTDAVEEFLRPGNNTLGVICGNGWYGTTRLLLQMNLEYSDGSSGVVYSAAYCPSGRWRVTGAGPIRENSVYDGELYDARLEHPGWDTPEVALPPDWPTAAGADGPGGKRMAAALEPIRVVETRRAQSITQPKPGVYVFDVGQNIAGWARLRVRGAAGERVSLKFAETLYPDGTINPENLRRARAQDGYILKGEGVETWEPRFTYHGFRYIQVEGYPGVPDAEAVEARVVRSAVEPSGRFECSSDLLNRIYRLVWQTEAANLHSLPTDCPQRDERMGWLNDMAARTEGALYNFNLARFLAKWITDVADEQDPASGAITDTAPFRWGRRPADPVSVAYLLIPWLLYVHYNDRHTLAERYDGMAAWVKYLGSRAPDGIVDYSYYGDWAPPVNLGLAGSLGSSAVSRDTPGSLVSTACYAYSASLLSRIAGVLGKTDDQAAYRALAEEVTARYNARHWNEESGGYGSNNQACNAISLYMDLVPAERRARVQANLVENVLERSDGHLTTGNICTKYLLEALTAGGRADVAYLIAGQETYPSWGFMLANGATTLWERWELATGSGMNSHDHPMMGSVAAWLYRAVAGIQADAAGPGFERFEIRPNFGGGLSYAHAALDTVRGTIECAWQVSAAGWSLDLRVPVGSQARVFVPLAPGGLLQEGESLLWQAGQPAAQLPAGLALRREAAHLVCQVGSGAYHFSGSVPEAAR
jgi:alpha-L-rhamnosidase